MASSPRPARGRGAARAGQPAAEPDERERDADLAWLEAERARLKKELSAAQRRIRALESVQGELSRRIDAAMQSIESVLKPH